MPTEDDWSHLRAEIRRVDEEIFDLVAQRLSLAAEIGDAKRVRGLPVKNYQVERAVLDRARTQATALGISEELAVALTRLLIDSSCRVQEVRFDVRSSTDPSKANETRIAIVGGHGRMGQWLGRFFESFGHLVSVLDPQPAPISCPYPVLSDLSETADHDAIVLATPISTTASLLRQLTSTRTRALVFDICSLKTPLLSAIAAAEDAGMRITSVHPMFGPAVESLVGRNIVVCEGREREASQAAAAFFGGSAAAVLRVPLERHDELMGIVLGLSHLTSLVFNEAIVRNGSRHGSLREVASTTFDAQCAVSERVAMESPDLYYEIQAENAFTPQVLNALHGALGAYTRAINERDPAAFRDLMDRGRRYFADPDPS